jgi:hypothetical protein
VSRRKAFPKAFVAAVCLAACTSVAACGSITSPSSAGANTTLQGDVLSLSQAAASHNATAARAALSQFRTDLASELTAGRISAAQAAKLRADADAIAGDLGVTSPSPTASPPNVTSSSTTHAAPTPKPSSAPKPKPTPKPKPKHGHGHGDGGGGGGDGGD